MSEALYRKYRPQVFEDVVGQEHIERTIKNAIERDKVSHAYLFTGPRGTGKTTTARLLAKALLCQKGPTSEPDGTCEDCELIALGEHPDVYELDAASRTGVDNVREEIIGRVQFAPTRGRYKIYIIDEVHMLSTAAFNALLKTLEEPPSHVVFILATTDPQKVPETIHSRCQRFDFRRISNDSIVSRLGAICVAEGVEYEEEALELIAHRAEGGMRNALTSLEQLIAFGEGSVSTEVAERMLGALDSSDLAEIVRFVGKRDVAACFKWTAEYVETGADLAQFTRDFAEHIRNLYVLSLAGAEVALNVSEAARREMMQELTLFGPDRLARLLGVLGDLSAELKTSTNPRLSFEIALTRMVRPESDLTLEGLAARIEALEARPAVVAPAFAEASVAPANMGGFVSANAGGSAPASAESSSAAPAHAGGFTAASVEPSPEPSRPAGGSGVASREQVTQVASAEAFASAKSAADRGVQEVSSEAPANTVASAGSVSGQLAAQLGNPAALQRLWQAALASLKKAKTAYGVLFLNTKALFDEAEGCLVIEFLEKNEFAFNAVQKPDIQAELGRSLAAACGAPVPFRVRKAGASGASANAGFAGAVSTASVGAASAGAVSSAASAGGSFAAASRSAAPQNQAVSRPVREESFTQARPQAQQPVAAAAASRSAAPDPAPYEYDAPPVDIYDDYVPYDDDGYGSYVPQPASHPAEQAASRPDMSSRAGQQASQAFGQQAPQKFEQRFEQRPAANQTAAADVPPWEAYASSQAQSQATSVPAAEPGKEVSAEDLNAVLAFGFGDGLTFTEV